MLELPLSPAKITVTETNLYLLQSWNRHQQWLDTFSLRQPGPGVSGGAAGRLQGTSPPAAAAVRSRWGSHRAVAGGGIESLLVFCPACPGWLHASVPAQSCRARKGSEGPLSNISVTNHFFPWSSLPSRAADLRAGSRRLWWGGRLMKASAPQSPLVAPTPLSPGAQSLPALPGWYRLCWAEAPAVPLGPSASAAASSWISLSNLLHDSSACRAAFGCKQTFAEQGVCKNVTPWLRLTKPEAESHFLPSSPCPRMAAEEDQEGGAVSCCVTPAPCLPPTCPPSRFPPPLLSGRVARAGFPLPHRADEWPGQGRVGPEVAAAGWLPRAPQSPEAGHEAAAVPALGSQDPGGRVTRTRSDSERRPGPGRGSLWSRAAAKGGRCPGSAREELPPCASDLLLCGICEASQGRSSGFGLCFEREVTVGRLAGFTFFFMWCPIGNVEHLEYFPALDSFNIHLGRVQCTWS